LYVCHEDGNLRIISVEPQVPSVVADDCIDGLFEHVTCFVPPNSILRYFGNSDSALTTLFLLKRTHMFSYERIK
jgi:hypothetical protein